MTEPVIRHYGPKAYPDHPPFSYPDYRSTVLRGPKQDLLSIVQTLTETTGPGPIWTEVSEEDADLTTNAGTGESAIGERIIVTGRVLDENGNGIPETLVEVWQANACGRYVHWRETAFPAPLDPNFIGVGQCVTDEDGKPQLARSIVFIAGSGGCSRPTAAAGAAVAAVTPTNRGYGRGWLIAAVTSALVCGAAEA